MSSTASLNRRKRRRCRPAASASTLLVLLALGSSQLLLVESSSSAAAVTNLRRSLEDTEDSSQGSSYSNRQYSNRSYNKYYAAESSGSNRQRSSNSNNSNADYKHYYTKLSDVFACLAMALGWTVWMLSSFVRTDIVKYHKGSVLVKGHIRQVSVEDSELGIPMYRAVIDYMVPSLPVASQGNENSSSNHSGSNFSSFGRLRCNGWNDTCDTTKQVHVRKQFETQQRLEEGFANVELLVLPYEPTHSVLRDDWEKDWEELAEEQAANAYWRFCKCRRISMAFAGSLVLASVSGAIHVVGHMDPSKQLWGWIAVCISVPLLIPIGIFVHWCLQAIQQLMDLDSEKQGIIIDGVVEQSSTLPDCGNFGDILDPAACDDEETDFRSIRSSIQVPETAGCYFIRLPNTRNERPGGTRKSRQDASRHQDKASDASASGSSISSISVHDNSHSGRSV